MKFWLTAALISLVGAAHAQEAVAVRTAESGAVLRALDTMNGALTDLEFANGETQIYERLEITMTECRYPIENPASDAFAHIVIRDTRQSEIKFDGWMTAASPALSAMDHPRYDVWVLRCKFPVEATPTTD